MSKKMVPWWFVESDPRFHLRFAFIEGPFKRLKDAEECAKKCRHKYWRIIRQEGNDIAFGNTKVVKENWK